MVSEPLNLKVTNGAFGLGVGHCLSLVSSVLIS